MKTTLLYASVSTYKHMMKACYPHLGNVLLEGDDQVGQPLELRVNVMLLMLGLSRHCVSLIHHATDLLLMDNSKHK